jgi:hypothetical protein
VLSETLCPIDAEVAEAEVTDVTAELLSCVVLLMVSLVIDSLTLADAEMGTSAVESAVARVLALISDAIGVIITALTFPLCAMNNYEITKPETIRKRSCANLPLREPSLHQR